LPDLVLGQNVTARCGPTLPNMVLVDMTATESGSIILS